MTLKYLIQKEFLQIRRNAFLPKLIIMFPIVIMCVMPWVMQMEVKNIVVDVVDIDHTVDSQRLVQQIAASNYFIFGGQKNTYAEAMKDIEKGRADVILEIRDGKYLIAANAVNGTKGSMGSAYLSQILRGSSSFLLPPSSTTTLYNKQQNYKLFMIPALFAIVMMLMTGFLPTLNIVGEKEAGTIEQINVTPVSKWSFILAKLIPYWLIALFVITVCLLLAWLVYGITPAGPVWLIYVLAMLLALFFSSFGLIVSNYSDTMQQAMFVMTVLFLYYPHSSASDSRRDIVENILLAPLQCVYNVINGQFGELPQHRVWAAQFETGTLVQFLLHRVDILSAVTAAEKVARHGTQTLGPKVERQ